MNRASSGLPLLFENAVPRDRIRLHVIRHTAEAGPDERTRQTLQQTPEKREIFPEG